MTQAQQFGEVWNYLRDNAKPIVPNDVYELRAVRDMGEPTTPLHAHALKRYRPEILVKVRRVKKPDETRQNFNAIVEVSKTVREAIANSRRREFHERMNNV